MLDPGGTAAVLGAGLSSGGGAAWVEHGRTLEARLATFLAPIMGKQSGSELPTPKAAPARAVTAPELPSEAAPTAEVAPPPAPSPPTESGTPSSPPETAPAAPENEAAARALAEFESLRSNGRTLKALHAIRKAAADHPREPAVLRAYTRAAQESKAWGEARRAALRWVESDPSPEARLSLARLERATGNVGRALALLTELAREDPKSEEVQRLLRVLPSDQKLALNR
jgi:hypothetical protein